jgi:hypothetical protein
MLNPSTCSCTMEKCMNMLCYQHLNSSSQFVAAHVQTKKVGRSRTGAICHIAPKRSVGCEITIQKTRSLTSCRRDRGKAFPTSPSCLCHGPFEHHLQAKWNAHTHTLYISIIIYYNHIIIIQYMRVYQHSAENPVEVPALRSRSTFAVRFL